MNVLAGGIAQADNTSNVIAAQLRLQGGTLENTVNNARVGDNTTNSNLWVDNNSVIRNTLGANNNFLLNVELNTAATPTLSVDSVNAASFVTLEGNISSTAFTGGLIDINTGILRMGDQRGLNGGTIQVDNGTTGLFRLGAGFENGQVNVLTNGIAEADNTSNAIAAELRLQGGTLRGISNNVRVGNNATNSNIHVDNDSELGATISGGQQWFIEARLNGTEDMAVNMDNATSILQLGYSVSSNTYSGTIDINTGIVRMANANGLSGGTVQVDNGTTGLFRVGEGFANGQVNVLAGGIAEADVSGDRVVSNLRLQGGLLRGTTNNAFVGNNTTNSNIHLDNASTIGTTVTGGNFFQIRSRLNGIEDILVNADNSGAFVYLNYSFTNDPSFTGDWDLLNGVLRVSNAANGNASFALGGGTSVNVAAGRELQFDDTGSNVWTFRHTATGEGSINLLAVGETLRVRRNDGDTGGGFSPGNSAGIFTVLDNLDFQPSDNTLFLPDLLIEVVGGGAVAGTDHDQLAVTGSVSNISNLDLLVDFDNLLNGGDLAGDTLTIVTSTLTDFTGQAFASETSLNSNWTFDVLYQNQQILLSNFQFTSSSAATTPEPGTLALGLIGLGLLPRRLRRRR